jgi:ABC-2 type transport system permease protein
MGPAIAGLVAWKVEPRIPSEAGEVVRALPLLGVALYAHMLLQAFWLNAFGWERGGARLLFLAPVELAWVLRAKGLVLLLASLLLLLASAAVMALVGDGGAPPWALAAALLLHAGTAPWFLAAGNLLSILRPRSASFAIQRSAALSTSSGLAGVAIVSAVGGVFALPVLIAIRYDSTAPLLAGWGVLGIAGAWAWWNGAPPEARLLERRRDDFLPAVCGDAD